MTIIKNVIHISKNIKPLICKFFLNLSILILNINFLCVINQNFGT